MVSICRKCGNIRFVDAFAYKQHLQEFHAQTFIMKAHNFTGRSKSAIIEDVETKIRSDAWFAHKLNPLLGTSHDSVEPRWDENMEIV